MIASGANRNACVEGARMLETPVSLLERIKQRGASRDWQQLIVVYTPLIHRWLLREPALQFEADDLTQEILSGVVQKLPNFVRQRTGSFRRWLRTITVSRLKDYWRDRYKRERVGAGGTPDSVLLQLEDPSSALSQQWDQEHDQHVVQSLLAMIEPEFSRKTWSAFTRSFFDEVRAAEIATQLGVSPNAVRLAKSRVLKRLRTVGRGLLD